MSSVSTTLRLLLFLAAGTSGAALLAHLHGIAPMHQAVPWIVVPTTVILIVAWVATRRRFPDVSSALSIGALGGLLGTAAYDLVRVPFMLAGQRIFVPIRVYGLWIVDANASSAFTDGIGWTYHTLNGITFGIMYALAMPRQRVIYAVVWAFALETMAVFSPFGRIFGLWGAWLPLFIAYLGHVAYGLPLGLCVRNWDGVQAWQARFARPLVASALTVSLACGVLVARLDRGDPNRQGLAVSDAGFSPDIVRVQRGDSLRVENRLGRDAAIERLPARDTIRMAMGSVAHLTTTGTGIERLRVVGNPFALSAFVLVEPVHALQRR